MKPYFLGLIALGAAALTPAVANETADNCRAYVAQNGGDASGCDCLGRAAASNPSLASALAAIRTPADLEAADASTKGAIQACYPNTDNPAIKG